MRELSKIKIAASQLMTPRTSFEDDVVAVSQQGYDGLGVLRDKLAECGVEKAAEMLAEFGLMVSSLQWAGGFTGDEVLRRNECIADARLAIEEAQAIRAGCLVVHSGARGGHTRGHSWRLFTSAIEELLPDAERRGVVLGLEPMDPMAGQRWSVADSLADTLGWVAKLDSPFVKLIFDSYHICRDPHWPHWLEEHRSRIALIQFADAKEPPSEEQNRCLLGTGELPLVSFLEKLSAVGYEGPIEVELYGRELEGKSFADILAHARNAMQRMLS